MKRVLDSSTAFKWLVAEVDSDKAIRLRDDFRNGLVELIAPDIFPAEMASSLLTAQRKRIERDSTNLKASNPAEAGELIHKRYRAGFGIGT